MRGRAPRARSPSRSSCSRSSGWTFDFYDLVLLGFIKDAVARDLGDVARGRGVAARRGARRLGRRRPGRRGARRSLRQAARARGDGAHLLARLARLRPGADGGRVLRGAGRAGARRRRRVGDRPRHARGGGRAAGSAGGPRRRCRPASRSASRSRRSSATWCCRGSAGARCSSARARPRCWPSPCALSVAPARPSPPTRADRCRGSCAPPRACPASAGASSRRGCSACSSSAPTGAATPGCRRSSAAGCSRASGARSPGWSPRRSDSSSACSSFGAVSDRLGRRPAFAIYSLLTAAAVGTLAIAWADLLPHPALFWAVMFALGVGSGCTAGLRRAARRALPDRAARARRWARPTTSPARPSSRRRSLVALAVARAGLSGGLAVPCVLALATAAGCGCCPRRAASPLPRLGRSLRPSAAADAVSLRR